MIVPIAVLLGPVANWITAGLDTRFHWSDGMPRLAFIAGVVVALASDPMRAPVGGPGRPAEYSTGPVGSSNPAVDFQTVAGLKSFHGFDDRPSVQTWVGRNKRRVRQVPKRSQQTNQPGHSIVGVSTIDGIGDFEVAFPNHLVQRVFDTSQRPLVSASSLGMRARSPIPSLASCVNPRPLIATTRSPIFTTTLFST